MRRYCSATAQRYPKISLSEERRLISEAQKGSKKSRDELVLRHINFLRFRIRRIAFPHLVQRFGDDLLGEAILIVYKKIENYDLDYCNKRGKPHPVKFISYIWKQIDGFIIDALKKELNSVTNYEKNYHNAVRKGVLSPMSGYSEADNYISRYRKYLRRF